MKANLSKTTKEYPKPIFNALKKKVEKDYLILSLRKEFRYHQSEETQSNQTLSNVTTHRMKLEENGNELQRYCDKMKGKMKTFVVKVEYYEKQIAKFKNEKKRIINANEAIIKQKKYEQSELINQMEVFSSKIEHQIEQIGGLETKKQTLEDQKQEETKEMMIKENESKKHYNNFYNQYRVLLGKLNIYEQESVEDENENAFMKRFKPSNGIYCSEDLKM